MSNQYKNFIWINLETTGDDPLVDKITNISLAVTDEKMNIIDDSDLSIKIPEYPDMDIIEDVLINHIKKIIPDGTKAPLAGFNVSAIDRPFVFHFFKKLEKECIHYRNLDTSSLKMIAENIYPKLDFKQNTPVTSSEKLRSEIKYVNLLQKNIFKKDVTPDKTVFTDQDDSKTPYLIWTDLETTGFDPVGHDIIEIATIVTDGNLNIINKNSFQEIIKVDENIIKNGNKFAIEMHRKNGLLERCKKADSIKTLSHAESKVMEFLDGVIPKGVKAPLAGNSIGSLDKPFIQVNMPTLNNSRLTESNLDVTSFTMLVNIFLPDLIMPEKTRNHLAMDDIIESIEELKFIKDNALKPYDEVLKKTRKQKPNI